MLPPLPNHPSRSTATNDLFTGIGPANGNAGGSILHQSVHIATPLPSPPPSPAGPGGKGGKKQNYQTNQNFPFLYPPPDEPNDSVAAKLSGKLNDVMTGRKWERTDVPDSIMEAGKLFASRMRMPRAMRQLWEERETFMKAERGWEGKSNSDDFDDTYDDNEDIPTDEDYLQSDSVESHVGDFELLRITNQSRPRPKSKETDDEDVQRRLEAVDDFYVSSGFFR